MVDFPLITRPLRRSCQELWILRDTTLIVPNSELGVFGSSAVPQTMSWIFGALIVAATALQRLLPLMRKPTPSGSVLLRQTAPVAGISCVVFGGIAVLGRGQGVPVEAWVFLALVGAVGFVLQRTRAGRAVYAVGGNREAARRAGYNPDMVRIVVFGLSGGFAALGGIYILARGGTADTLTGTGDVVLVAIAAAVIGGCSMFGGRGSPWAALIGVAVLMTLVEALNIANQGADVQLVLEGGILVAAVAIDAVMRKRLARSGGLALSRRRVGR